MMYLHTHILEEQIANKQKNYCDLVKFYYIYRSPTTCFFFDKSDTAYIYVHKDKVVIDCAPKRETHTQKHREIIRENYRDRIKEWIKERGEYTKIDRERQRSSVRVLLEATEGALTRRTVNHNQRFLLFKTIVQVISYIMNWAMID